MASLSKAYYDKNPAAKRKKKKYDTDYHKSKKRKKYRAELNRINRKNGTYGNGDGLDWDHGTRGLMRASKNRAKK